jgi:hypothetical protein
MTYTFKLARRLAVSRRLGMWPAILLFAGCSGDATAPETGDPQGRSGAVTVSVDPSYVTVETNQLIRFLAHGRNGAGDSVDAPITWRTTGGTILPDGRFSSASAGTFMVTGTTTYRDEEPVDTSYVQVVRRHTLLKSIEIAPGSVTLAPGLSQTFLVIGLLQSGRPVPVGVTWNATGGTIDAGGNYIAGDTAGTYRVIASHTTMSLSDTALVTITAAAPPPPPPPPPTPIPPPALAQVTLVPASATLAPAASRQFTAYGRTVAGDSVSVSVVFVATGGAVTEGGLYTAGSTPGTYRIIATSGTLADTSSLTIARPLGSGGPPGLPFGAWRFLTLGTSSDAFTLSAEYNEASTMVSWIDNARRRGVRVMLTMTGGAHSPQNPGEYLTVIDGVLQFDRAKWSRKQATFNTPEIRAAIASGVSDGTIVGASVMDEPYVIGNANGGGNTWGPRGTMTKARVDSLCAEVKSYFPTLSVGVVHQHEQFEPTRSYRVCEFIVDQYDHRRGPIESWRDAGLAMAQRDGHAVLFALNVLDGGVQDRDGTYDCAGPGQAGRGTFAPNCRMPADSVRRWGQLLGPVGCGLFLWRYDTFYMANAENQRAFSDIAAVMAAAPGRSCRRS